MTSYPSTYRIPFTRCHTLLAERLEPIVFPVCPFTTAECIVFLSLAAAAAAAAAQIAPVHLPSIS